MKTKVTVSVVSKNKQGSPTNIVEGGLPEIKAGYSNCLIGIHDKLDAHSSACIYCGSSDILSSEHIIPYALGGRLQIHGGSCELCRKKTEKFEGLILRGEMNDVRTAPGLPSRSGHQTSRKSIPMVLAQPEGEAFVEVDAGESPILHSFARFARPSELTGLHASGIAVTGVVSFNFGSDIEEFLKGRAASKAVLKSPTSLLPVEFAQMLGKIAYGFAWLNGATNYIDDMSNLIDAVLNNPNEIGRFVGCRSTELLKYAGIQHRLQFVWQYPNFVCLEVQLFADAGTPTYLVVLGRSDVRRWRKLRLNVPKILDEMVSGTIVARS